MSTDEFYPFANAEQKARFDALLARRDALVAARPAATMEFDFGALDEFMEIADDESKSQEDLLRAMEKHVAKLERLLGAAS